MVDEDFEVNLTLPTQGFDNETIINICACVKADDVVASMVAVVLVLQCCRYMYTIRVQRSESHRTLSVEIWPRMVAFSVWRGRFEA